MTIHGSKLELEWPRYHVNQDNAPIDVPLTSGSRNFLSDRCIFKFHAFLEIGSQDLSKGVKTNPIRGHLKMSALQGPRPRKVC